MKKNILLICITISLVFSGVLAAQDAEKAKFFVKTIDIALIYPHQLGYIISWVKSDSTVQDLYIPMSWFSGKDRKAQIVWGDNPAYPYFSIFWKEGQFDHIRIYVKQDRAHPSWAAIYDDEGLKERFDATSTPTEF